jgi:hypothetical protein
MGKVSYEDYLAGKVGYADYVRDSYWQDLAERLGWEDAARLFLELTKGVQDASKIYEAYRAVYDNKVTSEPIPANIGRSGLTTTQETATVEPAAEPVTPPEKPKPEEPKLAKLAEAWPLLLIGAVILIGLAGRRKE